VREYLPCHSDSHPAKEVLWLKLFRVHTCLDQVTKPACDLKFGLLSFGILPLRDQLHNMFSRDIFLISSTDKTGFLESRRIVQELAWQWICATVKPIIGSENSENHKILNMRAFPYKILDCFAEHMPFAVATTHKEVMLPYLSQDVTLSPTP
jgi:hypothetical protein